MSKATFSTDVCLILILVFFSFFRQ